jgi:site-specific recombinase XerD
MSRLRVTELSRDIKLFLDYKRARGYSYKRAEFTLRSFECFAKAQAGTRGQSVISLENTLKAWLSRGEGRSSFTAALDLGVLRQLCLYRRRRDPDGFVPDHSWAPNTESIYVPHIFSREEIRRLLLAASQPHSRRIPPAVVRTLILILYCTGLRFGEGVRLSLGDVDLRRHSFLIRESKGRTRIVPFGTDLSREIKRYLAERERLVEFADPTTALFIDRLGRPLKMKALSDVIRKLLREEGLKPARGRRGARPYDFRHAFAVHRLTDWYRKGADIHARLPWLSAYMGHVNVIGTEVYLHATPELLRVASQRLRRRLNLRQI